MKLTIEQEKRLSDLKMQGTLTRQDAEDYIELLAIEGKVIKKVDAKLATSRGDSTVVNPKDTTTDEGLVKGDGRGEDSVKSKEDEKSDKGTKSKK